MRSLMASMFAIMVGINVAMAGYDCWIEFAVGVMGTSVYSVITFIV